MHLLGCLLFFLLFILIFGLAIVGSFIEGIWRLLTGGKPRTFHSDSTFSQNEQKENPTPRGNDYTFSPNEGEYIDYEEVRD